VFSVDSLLIFWAAAALGQEAHILKCLVRILALVFQFSTPSEQPQPALRDIFWHATP
jgi:hypothetical protein